MKITIEIPDNKATFFLELIKNFSFIKTTKISESEFLKSKEELTTDFNKLNDPESKYLSIDELDSLLNERISKYEG